MTAVEPDAALPGLSGALDIGALRLGAPSCSQQAAPSTGVSRPLGSAQVPMPSTWCASALGDHWLKFKPHGLDETPESPLTI